MDSTIINHFLNTNSGCPECGSKGSGKKKRTSQKDVENKIRKISAAEGLKTNGWVDEYVNAHSKFRWTCSSGHSCQTSVDKFIGGRERKGTRCPSCWDESNYLGYYPERADEQDTLYLLRFTRDTLEGFLETFIKIGRTFDIDRRMKEFRKSEYVIEVLAINQGTHREVYDTEQYYHSVGRDHHYKPLVDFAGSLRECFTLTVLDLITFED